MRWKNVTDAEEITRFVLLAQRARYTVTELCEQFGISRKTRYKHLERYAATGLKGLQPRSHRPHAFPQRTDEAMEAMIVAERRLHRTWGPKKLHKILQVKHGIESPPARSTIGQILRRHGLSVPRRRKPGLFRALNDGLGWFNLGSGQRCDSLTVCDRYSHYVLGLRARGPDQQFKGTLHAFQCLRPWHPAKLSVENCRGPTHPSPAIGTVSRCAAMKKTTTASNPCLASQLNMSSPFR